MPAITTIGQWVHHLPDRLVTKLSSVLAYCVLPGGRSLATRSDLADQSGLSTHAHRLRMCKMFHIYTCRQDCPRWHTPLKSLMAVSALRIKRLPKSHYQLLEDKFRSITIGDGEESAKYVNLHGDKFLLMMYERLWTVMFGCWQVNKHLVRALPRSQQRLRREEMSELVLLRRGVAPCYR
eukprot:scaffold1809_cov386-Prasinococcus_capsulatus_cf.AAC.2